MVVLNARDIDATFLRISLWNLNLYLFFRQEKNTPFIPGFLMILKRCLFGLLQEMSFPIYRIHQH